MPVCYAHLSASSSVCVFHVPFYIAVRLEGAWWAHVDYAAEALARPATMGLPTASRMCSSKGRPLPLWSSAYGHAVSRAMKAS